MKQRILTSAVGLPILFYLLLGGPLWLFGAVFGGVCALACYELMHIALSGTPRRIYFSAMVCAWAMPVICSLEGNFAWGVGILLLLFFVLSVEQMVTYVGKWRVTLEMIAVSMLAGGVIPMMLSTLLRIGQVPEVGRVRMVLPFVVAFSTDAGAYFVGMKLGKRKLAPHISPKKTLEGSAGGLACGVAGALIYGLILRALHYQVNLLSLFGFGMIGSAVAQLGDLTFSAFKRQFGAKDYGYILPGHGGVLDRFDSMIYLAPLAEVWLFALPGIWR